MTPAIEVQDLSFSYDSLTALKNVSFTINEGEFAGIIGPNGGGKTTLLKLLLGFLTPSQGTVKIFGKPPSTARKCMAYVPQAVHYDPEFPISVLEVVLGGKISKLSWFGGFPEKEITSAKECLEKMDLSTLADRSFGSLSTGQAQRALFARALVSNPKILLLDEPTACVDHQSESQIHHLLHALPKKITVLMVTHDLQTILEDVQKVLTVHGTIDCLGPKEVCEHFKHGVYHKPGEGSP